MLDNKLLQAIVKEQNRQDDHIELIASENFTSKAVRDCMSTILTNKYAEGYPNKRYYGGCEFVDEVENIARNYLIKLYNAEHVNVQPHSGSQANMAVYMAILKPGDKVLGMDLVAGGHLTHGSPVSFSGMLYDFYTYGVNKQSEMLDYDEIDRLANEIRPKLIVAGASAYSRFFDFKRLRNIADKYDCLLMFDMAHIAGLVAAKLHDNPVEYCDFVTTTTHKTLRGPRGGAILCKDKYAKVIDKAIFPGIQGGPLMHIIAAKAQCFYEASTPEFVSYANSVINNCKALCKSLMEENFRIVSGGSDNHLILVDVKGSIGISGKEAEKILDEINITCNKNSIPFDSEKPNITSGIRLGSAAMSTKGFNEDDFYRVGKIIADVLKNPNEDNKNKLKKEVIQMALSHKDVL